MPKDQEIARRVSLVEDLLRDLRYAARMLRRSPGFTAVAVLSLALGIGANTAIFSVVNAVILRPLPYPEPDRLARASWQFDNGQLDAVTSLVFEYWKAHSRSFEAVAGFAGINSGFNLSGGAEARRVRGLQVSEGLFGVLGVGPVLGRGFSAEEDRPAGPGAIIVADSLWREYFNGDPALIGKSVVVNGQPRTVVGILPPGFRFESPIDVLLPLQSRAVVQDDGQNTGMIVRLKAGTTREQAEADVAQLLAPFRRDYPTHLRPTERGMSLTPYKQTVVGDVSGTLWLLLGAVGLVLLIACANVASLMLARAAVSKGEMAIRIALGAGRWRVIRQVLTESWLVALCGSLAGLAIAWWTVPALLMLAPEGLPRLGEIRVDYQVVMFAVAASVLTSLLAGLAPAIRTTGVDVSEGIKASSRRNSAGRSASRLRRALVVGEVTLTLVLLVGAVLLVRSFLKLRDVELGFEPQSVTTAQVALTSAKYQTSAQVWAFQRQVLERVATLPGVIAAASASNLPLERGLRVGMGVPGSTGRVVLTVQVRAISPEYFRALGIPLLRGREFNAADSPDSIPVMIVNQALARRFAPDRDVLSEQPAWQGRNWQVVGMARDIREIGIDKDAEPTVYVPAGQLPDGMTRAMNQWFLASWIVRTAGQVPLTGVLRQAVSDVDAQLPLVNVRPLTQVVQATFQSRQFVLLLMLIFAGLAVVLTAVGIYGVLSYQVTQRSNELGIRLALGATQGRILWTVLKESLGMVAAGIALGVPLTLACARLIASLLFGVSPADPWTLAAGVTLMVVLALLAGYVPARRASRLDPVTALRCD